MIMKKLFLIAIIFWTSVNQAQVIHVVADWMSGDYNPPPVFIDLAAKELPATFGKDTLQKITDAQIESIGQKTENQRKAIDRDAHLYHGLTDVLSGGLSYGIGSGTKVKLSISVQTTVSLLSTSFNEGIEAARKTKYGYLAQTFSEDLAKLGS